MSKMIFFLALLFTTFQSIYFYSINLAPFPLLSLILLFCLVRFRLDEEEIKFYILFLLLIVISFIIGYLNKDYVSQYSFYLPRAIGWLLFPLNAIMFKKAFCKFDYLFINKCITYILIIHLSLFFIQYFSYHLLNFKIDYLINVTGEEQRVGAAKLKLYSTSMIRPSGLFTEPGSYSVYIYILICIKFLLDRKSSLVVIIGLISMLLSFSMTGIMMAAFFILLQLIYSNISVKKIFNFMLVLLGLGVVIYIKSDVFLGPIQERIYNLENDSSANARFEAGIDSFVNEGHFYSGVGIGALSENIRATSVILGGLFDLGIILLVLFLLFHIIYIYKWGKLKYILFLIPVLFSNISFNQVIYTMFFAFLLSSQRILSEHENYINKNGILK